MNARDVISFAAQVVGYGRFGVRRRALDSRPHWTGDIGRNILTGGAVYDDCDCCNTQASTSLPELIIVDYDARVSCSALGTWPLYMSSFATYCNRSSWTQIGTATVS